MLKKAAIVQKAKTTEHTRTERQVLEHIRQSPFLVTLHYAFQTQSKLHLILGELNISSESKGFFSSRLTWNTEQTLSVCFCLLLCVGTVYVCVCFCFFFVLSLFKLPCLFVCLCVRADYVSGGEMFTHLYQRDHFPEEAVRIYIGEIILALEHLHKVGVTSFIFRLLLQLGSDLHFSMKFLWLQADAKFHI